MRSDSVVVAGEKFQNATQVRFAQDNHMIDFRKLQMIDDATTDLDLRVPARNHFEKLRGKLEDLHSILVNSFDGMAAG
jgi:plasmid maintenance system killer protein